MRSSQLRRGEYDVSFMARPTSDERKSIILDAVVDIIIEVGFTQMTVADVAKRAEVSTSLVHYHFSSKADLITAALRVASDEDKQLLDSSAAAPGSALERLDRVLCRSLPQDPNDPTWLLWIETWGETRRVPSIRDVMTDLNMHEHEIVVSLIEAGLAGGEFDCDDPSGVARQLSALRDGLAIQQTLFESEDDVRDSASLLREAIRNSLVG
jgi:AcrR family transcriptional regulator